MSGMRYGIGAVAALAVVGLFALTGSAADDASAMAAAVERGRQIYTTGTSALGDELQVVLDLIGDRQQKFPAARYACINCHGDDGLPTTEGGVGVPNIQAHRLAVAVHAGPGSSRSRPPYTSETLGRTIRHGIDSAGNRLNAVMPRFDISDRDLRDLTAYIETLGTQALAGMTDDHCAVGVVVGKGPGAAAEIATLRAFCAETNSHSGIYGRRLELVERDAAQWDIELASPAGRASVAALVVTEGAGSVTSHDLPLIHLGGSGLLSATPGSLREFHLNSTLAIQLGVAIQHIMEVADPQAATFVVVAEEADQAKLLESLQQYAEACPDAQFIAGKPGDVPEITGDREGFVLLAASPTVNTKVIEQLAGREDVRSIYCTHRLEPGLVQRLQPEGLRRLRLLLPVPLPAANSTGVTTFREFLQRHELPETQVPRRVAALAGGIVFAEALKRCGMRASRERLVETIGSMHMLRAGLFAPLTFTNGVGVGIRGAQVVRIDPETRSFEPWSDWMELR